MSYRLTYIKFARNRLIFPGFILAFGKMSIPLHPQFGNELFSLMVNIAEWSSW